MKCPINMLHYRVNASLHKSKHSYLPRLQSTGSGPSNFLWTPRLQVQWVVTAAVRVEEQRCSILPGASKLQLQAGVQTLHTLHELREVCVVGNADGCIAAERLQEFRHTQQL